MKKNGLLLIFLLTTIFAWGQDSEIKGKITKEDGSPVSGVMVLFDRLGGALPDTVYTDVQGNYSYAAFSGFSYQVIPQYDLYHANGLDQSDPIIMRGLILDTLSYRLSPYQLIAADANRNGGISTFDLVTVFRVMLGIEERFRDNTSWRFVLADHEFANENPWQVETFPEYGEISNIEAGATVEINFIGIKIGDLNCSAITNLADLNEIQGKVNLDTNADCIGDQLGGTIGATILVSNDNFSRISRVRADGTFSLFAPSGMYELNFETASGLWTVCESSSNIQLTGGEMVRIDPVLSPSINCPYLEVNIATSVIWRCRENKYSVTYSNKGTAVAEDAYIEVQLDPFLTLKSSSIPVISTEGNRYTFSVGDLEIGASGSFTLTVFASCEAELGQTHCTEATIFPQSDCIPTDPAWNGASLKVHGTCEGDVVRFSIKNIGANMTMPTHYLVVEDDLIMRRIPITLGAGEEEPIEIASDGKTIRIEVEQPEGHPFNHKASASVEGCGTNAQGEFSLGFITQFSEHDDAPFQSISCRSNSDFIDYDYEVTKEVFPRGIGENNVIEPNTDVEYFITFQNTTNAAVSTLVIKDTLSPFLNPISIQPGASSHPYYLTVDGNIVTIELDSTVTLPSMNDDPAASKGFVSFRVAQLPDNEVGTIINSKSIVFMGIDLPQVTNTVRLTIGEAFSNIVSNASELNSKMLEIKISPNPAQGITTFHLEEAELLKGALQNFQ